VEKKVFVLGEVKNPGAYPLMPNMRLSHALALAGGATDVATLENARIIRGDLDNPRVVEADFTKVVQEGDQAQDLILQASDLIVLPRSRIGNWNAFLAKVRPSLEILTLPLAVPVQVKILGTNSD
jgi:polysaccharide export outer membrane protein